MLAAQLERYPHLPRELDGLHAYCDELSPFETEFDRWFADTDSGLQFKRGKHTGSYLDDVAQASPDYLDWMLGADDMPPEVLDVIRAALERAAG